MFIVNVNLVIGVKVYKKKTIIGWEKDLKNEWNLYFHTGNIMKIYAQYFLLYTNDI